VNTQNQSLVIATPKRIGPVIPPAEVVEPKELLRNLSRGRKKIFGIAITLMVLTGIILSQVTPRYAASTLIMINRLRSNIVDFDSMVAGMSLDNDTIASEIEIIKSRGLATKVIESLSLSLDPEFNTALKPKDNLTSFIQEKEYIPKAWRNFLWPESGEVKMENYEAAERTRVIDKFIEGLEVSRKGNSRMIEVTYTSENPNTAEQVANNLVDIYIGEQLKTKFDSTRDATKWLTERVEPLRKKVLKSEKAIEQYRQKSGLIENMGLTVNSQQMAELNSQLILSQTDYLQAQTRLDYINKLSTQHVGIESAAEVLNSSLIQNFREQEATLQRKMGELSVEFGDLHPKMIKLRAELDDLQTKIDVEVNKVISSIRYEAEMARVRKESLEASLNKLREQDAGINAARVQLQALQREAEADRNVLQALLARLKETSSQENVDIHQADAQVISVAEIPLEPSYPKTAPILGLMLFASTLTGILFVFARESMDTGFHNGDEIELQTGMPSLGYLRKVRTGLIGCKPETNIVIKHGSAFAESIISLYTNILLTASSGHPKTILVTSAESGEGKTTIAACLARARALAGSKTIIVDLNLRKPSLHTVFGIQRSPGVIEYLSGNSSLEEVVHKDPVSEANVIPAGAACLSPTDILMGHNLGTLIRDLADEYDLVIFDSAPIMTVPDTRLVLDKIDTTVFVVRWAQTKRSIVRKALAMIMLSGERFLGVVLNRVDVKKNT